MARDHWQRKIEQLDPEVDFAEIYRILGAHEFPWDITQALGLALYRTYAVPSIGQLLDRTGEFEHRTHKRYADTGLILEAVIEHGFGSATGRSAIRRMNQMHGSYAISNDDMRYVLSTFVVVPTRWLDRFGWRALSEAERRATANYYAELGRHMNIQDRPATYEEFAALLTRTSASTSRTRRAGVRCPMPRWSCCCASTRGRCAHCCGAATMALLDQPLREAFAYPRPDRVTAALTIAGLRARALVERRLPPRIEPHYVRDMPEFAIYPDGYRVEELGTFPS